MNYLSGDHARGFRSPSAQPWIYRLGCAAAAISLGVGAAVWLGWLIDSPVLKGAIGVPITIKANTALCFVLLGAALWLSLRPHPSWLPAARTLAAIAGLVGALTVFEHLFGVDLGLDQLFFREPAGQAATSSPGRMGPPASLSFTLLGLSLVLQDWPVGRGRFPFRYLPVLTLIISMIPLAGYSFGSPQLYSTLRRTEIAWPTAVTLLILSIGVLASRPENALVRLLSAADMGGVVARRLLLPSIAVPFLLLLGYAVALDSQWIDRSSGRGILAVVMMVTIAGVVIITALRLSQISLRAQSSDRARQAAEQRAIQSNDLLRITLTSIGDAVIATDQAGTVTFVNRVAEDLTGWPEADAVGRKLTEIFRIVNEYTREPVENPVRRVLEEGEIVGLANHTLLIRRDGLECAIDDSAAPIRDDRDKVVGAVLVFHDVTERRTAERKLLRSERELSDFFETAAIGLHWVGPDGTILRANRADHELLGFTAEEYVGHLIQEFHADQPVIEDILRRLSAGELLHDYPARLRCKDGSIKDVLINSSVLWEDGKFIHTRCFTRDVTDLKRATMATRQLAAIVESSDDAIVGKNLESIVTSWNRGAERIFGYAEAEMIGRPISLIIPPDRVHEEQEIIARIRRGEKVEHFESIRQRKDGSRFSVSLTISPIRDANGKIIGASKIARDVTDRRRSEAEREQLLQAERTARAQAERAMQQRDEFLAVVSHELRTPLNGILGWAQLLKRGRKDEHLVSEGLEAIERGARAQAQLIEDLLDMNRILAGKLHLDVRSVELPGVIAAALDTLRPAAAAKEIELQTVLDTTVGPIRGDAVRLQQVIWNLVSNAVKFTPKGGRVQVALRRVESQAEICVSDSGPGIRSEFLPYVFDRFRQADSTTTRQYGGLGLGLAIVKQLTELHGGVVAVESPGPDQGATFYVRLPIPAVRRDREDAVNESPPPAERAALHGIRVLVVDDDPTACAMLKRLLQGQRAQVETVYSGDEAIDRLPDFAPHVLLSDISMPNMDGYQLIQSLRSRGVTTPAVAVTAFARAEDRIRTLQAGYNMHLAKPIDMTELVTVIESVLRNVNSGS